TDAAPEWDEASDLAWFSRIEWSVQVDWRFPECRTVSPSLRRTRLLTPASRSCSLGCRATIAHPQPSVVSSMCTAQWGRPTGLHSRWPKNRRLALSKKSCRKNGAAMWHHLG